MKKENFVATMIAIYAILLTLCIAIYAFIDFFKIDKSLASNLLVWSATLFAPIALLMTYENWRAEKASEVIAEEAKQTIKDVLEMIKIINYLKQDHYDDELRTEQFKRFKLLFENCVSNILYIDDCINVSGLKDELFKLSEKFQEIKLLEKKKLLNKASIGKNREFVKIIHEFSSRGINIVNILNIYSIYKANIDFKH